MPLIKQIREAVENGNLKQPFTVESVKQWIYRNQIVKDDGGEYAKSSINAILSNSDIKNLPTTNKNIKPLKSKLNVNGKKEYWFYIILIVSLLLFTVANNAIAEESFNTIGGYSLDQSCTGSEFKTSDSDVSNPDDISDKIKVKRKQIKKNLESSYLLRVTCGIIDNKVKFISLTSEIPDDISDIKKSLVEKMGRPADDIKNNSTNPSRIMGMTMDGYKLESEYWYLPNSRKATAYTSIKIPYGSTSITELKWYGGIELSISDNGKTEWEYLKQKGSLSSKEADSLNAEKRKKRLRGLLE